jgi:hypothetical protein
MDIFPCEISDIVKKSKFGVPCGGCQWMGKNPDFDSAMTCKTCGRSEEEIINDHGVAYLTEEEKKERNDLAMHHMLGGKIQWI